MQNTYIISADIEGISGVVDSSYSNSDGKHYSLACKYMTSDINAVVEGILDSDPDAKIVVRDAHGSANNVDLLSLHPRAYLMQGWGTSFSMVAPLEKSVRGVFLVGYHAGGGNSCGVLAHTFSSNIAEVKINGVVANEASLAAIHAAHYSVPIVFLSGDDEAVLEANYFSKSSTASAPVLVTVKKSFARNSVLSLPLAEASALLRKGAKEASAKLLQKKFAPLKVKLPISFEIKLYNTGYRKSLYQHFYELLSFDNTLKFDPPNYTFRFKETTALRGIQRFNMLATLLYSLKD
ncbi:MAG: M55 family metallopeptidase [Oligoflexia bacterium]|nr:M55 family metallopeptidase [Oligoflexia bacterium]MBF0366238.1 M55 family metallopeptidase [Oligoflexia bacterium]